MPYGFNDDKSKNDLSGFAAASHTHDAADIGSGTFDVERIPDLSTDKLTDGTLPVERGGTGVSGVQYTSASLNSAVSGINTNDVWSNGIAATVTLVDFSLASALANNGNIVIGTVPEGFRPPRNAYAQCILPSTIAYGIWARITASGEIRISNRSGSQLSAGTVATFTLSYCVA